MMWLYAPFAGSRSAPAGNGVVWQSAARAFGELWREVRG